MRVVTDEEQQSLFKTGDWFDNPRGFDNKLDPKIDLVEASVDSMALKEQIAEVEAKITKLKEGKSNEKEKQRGRPKK